VEAHTAWNTPAERASTLEMVAKARAEFTRRHGVSYGQ
jgi:peroxiredoxin